jgi:hypothetical protein
MARVMPIPESPRDTCLALVCGARLGIDGKRLNCRRACTSARRSPARPRSRSQARASAHFAPQTSAIAQACGPRAAEFTEKLAPAASAPGAPLHHDRDAPACHWIHMAPNRHRRASHGIDSWSAAVGRTRAAPRVRFGFLMRISGWIAVRALTGREGVAVSVIVRQRLAASYLDLTLAALVGQQLPDGSWEALVAGAAPGGATADVPRRCDGRAGVESLLPSSAAITSQASAGRRCRSRAASVRSRYVARFRVAITTDAASPPPARRARPRRRVGVMAGSPAGFRPVTGTLSRGESRAKGRAASRPGRPRRAS